MKRMRTGMALAVLLLAFSFAGTMHADAAASKWNGKAASSFGGGSGTSASPYQIKTAGQLAYLAKMVNAGQSYEGKYFVLKSNINLNKKEWTPIGCPSSPFRGNFDGGKKTISNLKITKAKEDTNGLFGTVNSEKEGDGTYIKNLKLTNVSINTYYDSNKNITGNYWNYTGGLAGCCYRVEISGVTVSGSIYGCKQVAGIAGGQMRDSYIHNCTNNASVSGATSTGGIAGWSNNVKDTANCKNNGRIKGIGNSFYTGGILGQGGHAYNCCNYGDITGSSYVGGVIGSAYRAGGFSNGSAEKCYNTGTILGKGNVGGIIGSGMASYCANLGYVKGTGDYVGGISGAFNGTLAYITIQHCINYGDVSGVKYVGGILGGHSAAWCINKGNVSGSSSVGGVIGDALHGGHDLINHGKVTASALTCYAGGVIGATSNTSDDYYNLMNTGKVTGKSVTGGVMGYLCSSDSLTNGVFVLGTCSKGLGGGNSDGSAVPYSASQLKGAGIVTLMNNSLSDEDRQNGEKWVKTSSYPKFAKNAAASSSLTKKATTLGKPKLKVKSRTATSVKVSVSGVSGSQGIDVYRYNAKTKKWSKRGTVSTDTALVNYISLKKNTTYKFKMRAYKYIGGKKYYSKYSNVVKAKTKKK